MFFFYFGLQDHQTYNNVSQAIREIIDSLMESVLNRVLVTDPFIVEEHHAKKPLYAALVPDEIFKGSHFERRFVTPFGSAWEKLALAVGKVYHGSCTKGSTVEGTIGQDRLKRIQEILNHLEHGTKGSKKHKPNWEEELSYILEAGGEPIPVSVTCDILVQSQIKNETYAFELKGPLPNSDQTKVSKEKMFKLLAMDGSPVTKAFYALPYNPYGKKENYQWSFPERWFNMKEDPCVLIGEELWNFIGGEGTYRLFIDEVNKLGTLYKERIYREFLGIEPPEGFDKQTLK